MTDTPRWKPLFSALEGRRGENMSSAVLAYLLSESEQVREKFFKLIRDECPGSRIPSTEQLQIETEKSVSIQLEQERNKTPRMDLFIKTKTLLIGIENKFFAPFEDSQLDRYLHALRQLADVAADDSKTKPDHLLVTLTPKFRLDEAKKLLHQTNSAKRTCALTWEAVIEAVCSNSADDEFTLVSRELKKYTEDYLGAAPKLTSDLLAVLKSWSHKGTCEQRKILDQFLWNFLHESVTTSGRYRYSSASNYYGWYLYPRPDQKDNLIWIGFKEYMFVEGKSAALLIGIKEPDALRAACRGRSSPKLIEDLEASSEEWRYFRVPFDETDEWLKSETWQTVLEPFNRFLEEESHAKSEENPDSGTNQP